MPTAPSLTIEVKPLSSVPNSQVPVHYEAEKLHQDPVRLQVFRNWVPST